MRWRYKPDQPEPEIGDKKIERVFCWLPRKSDDGFVVWLGRRKDVYVYAWHNVRLPITYDLIETTGWIKDCVLSRVPFDLISKIAVQSIKPPKVL